MPDRCTKFGQKALKPAVKSWKPAPSLQLAITLAAMSLLAKTVHADPQRDWALCALLTLLLRRSLPFDEQTLTQLLHVAETCVAWELPVGSVIGAVDRYVKQHGLPRAVRLRVESLHRIYHSKADYADERKVGKRIESILSCKDHPINPKAFELHTGEAWTDVMLVELGQLNDNAREHWHALLEHCQTARSSKPSKKWLKEANRLLDPIGTQPFVNVLCQTLAAIGEAGKSQVLNYGGWTHYSDPTEIHDTHVELLRGLVWTTSLVDNDALIAAVGDAAERCFKKIPNVGPRSPKIGNACLVALSSMATLTAVAQLGRLKARATHASTRKQIARALERVAATAGMTETDLEELAVPTFGFTEVGRYVEQVGEFIAEITVKPHGKPELWWTTGSGKRQKAVPASVKVDSAGELKSLKTKIKDITALMPSLRFRVEQLLRNPRSWSLVEFRNRFLDHPLVGVIARRLIWNFGPPEAPVAAFTSAGEFVDASGKAVDWIDDETTVTIWHPLQASPAEVFQWRERLEQQQIVQPFKQAHREVYILTDAERETHDYSNRFAAHILRQHQFSALCDQRGWRYRLQGEWDSSNAPFLELPRHDLYVEFWVEPVENREVSEARIFVYVATDHVRFSRPGVDVPLPLEDVPPCVFSEVMRDIDLFVGVASVGNDPEWADGGMQAFDGYWHDYAYGRLSQTAVTRKEVLQRVIPRLRIAEQCRFGDKFLIVEGRLRTYKIHLGSGNVLMLPNDQYLCVVPKRGGTTKQTDGIYLPFEGDSLLSVILSKAFLLADDDEIKDPSIAHQIGKMVLDPPR